jgi:hypothetical protein
MGGEASLLARACAGGRSKPVQGLAYAEPGRGRTRRGEGGEVKEAAMSSQGKLRLRQANCLQIEIRASDLEPLLVADHRALLVSGYVERQYLSKLFDCI